MNMTNVNSEEGTRQSRTTQLQISTLVSFVESHPEMLSGQHSQHAARLWAELAEILNGLKGPKKNSQQWKKVLRLLKSNYKRKVRERKSKNNFFLTTMESRVLGLPSRGGSVIPAPPPPPPLTPLSPPPIEVSTTEKGSLKQIPRHRNTTDDNMEMEEDESLFEVFEIPPPLQLSPKNIRRESYPPPQPLTRGLRSLEEFLTPSRARRFRSPLNTLLKNQIQTNAALSRSIVGLSKAIEALANALNVYTMAKF